MLRDMPVRDLMVTDVLAFTGHQSVQDAMRLLVERDVDAAPVIDADGRVIGMLSTGDVIVEEARLHFPTIVNFLGVNVVLPWHDKELDESVAKALGEFVEEVMSPKPVVVGPDATIEDAATLMHDHQVSRLPVVDNKGRLLGLLARGDIVRAMVKGLGEPPSPDSTRDDTTEADDTSSAPGAPTVGGPAGSVGGPLGSGER